MNSIRDSVKEFLISNCDNKYLEFSKSLNIKNKKLKQLGVRIPILRRYARELYKEYSIDYLIDNIDEEYYEEILLKGYIIGLGKNISYLDLERYIKYYVSKINDWSICDSFCCSLKITKKYYSEVFILINKYLKSNKEFQVRFGLVMLLNYYLNDEYIDRVFDIISNVCLDKYYVKMANAWLISFCFVKYFDRTYEFVISNKNLDKWTICKGIQKAMESYRISSDNKDKLRSLRDSNDFKC